MEKTQSLTPEQKKEIESLTPAEAQQIMDLVGSNGKIDEAKLELVSGGVSDRVKKIAKWGGAALAAVAAVATAGYVTKGKLWGKKAVVAAEPEAEPAIESEDMKKARELKRQKDYSSSPSGTFSGYWSGQTE